VRLPKLLAGLLFLPSLWGSVGAQRPVQFDFRGHRLGDTAWTELSSDISQASCSLDDEETQDSTCYLFEDRVGDVKTDISLSFASGRLISVHLSFSSDDYETIAAAFRAKYGPPHRISHEIVSTAMGARYRNETLRWRTTSGELVVARYGSKVSEGYAYIISRRGLQRLKQRDARQEKKTKEDL
jgi:hypothetical protein